LLTQRISYNISYPVYKGAQYDASTTNLSYQISAQNAKHDPLDLTISFFSPITPTSTLRQGIPASYINIIVDGDFDIDIYMDVNGLWVSGDDDANITWSKTNTTLEDASNLQTWQIQREKELLFSENEDRADWGRLLFSGPSVCSNVLQSTSQDTYWTRRTPNTNVALLTIYDQDSRRLAL